MLICGWFDLLPYIVYCQWILSMNAIISLNTLSGNFYVMGQWIGEKLLIASTEEGGCVLGFVCLSARFLKIDFCEIFGFWGAPSQKCGVIQILVRIQKRFSYIHMAAVLSQFYSPDGGTFLSRGLSLWSFLVDELPVHHCLVYIKTTVTDIKSCECVSKHVYFGHILFMSVHYPFCLHRLCIVFHFYHTLM